MPRNRVFRGVRQTNVYLVETESPRVWWYASRMVNLTTLTPNIIAATLDDTLPNHITLFDLAVDPPTLWDEQRAKIGGAP